MLRNQITSAKFQSPLVTLLRHFDIVAHFLKGRTVEPEKQPLLGNGRAQQYMNCHDSRCDAYSRCYGTTE
jgi:hypothetical protein